MKLTAREEKERRQQERNQLLRERDARKIAEQDKIDLRDQVLYFRDQATILQKEIDKLHIVHERTQISQEEINLMQLQISQKYFFFIFSKNYSCFSEMLLLMTSRSDLAQNKTKLIIYDKNFNQSKCNLDQSLNKNISIIIMIASGK